MQGFYTFSGCGQASAYEGRKGSVKLFDFTHPEGAEILSLEATTGFDPDTFQPHGISSWTDPKSGRAEKKTAWSKITVKNPPLEPGVEERHTIYIVLYSVHRCDVCVYRKSSAEQNRSGGAIPF